jgi:hypothetical protein
MMLAASCSPAPSAKGRPILRSSPSAQSSQWPNPTPAIAVGVLPEQASLYAVVVAEFVRLGWKSVCVGAMPHPGAAEAADPSSDATAWLSAHDIHFRPRSACRVDGEDVIDMRSGKRDGVMVTVVGANRDQDDMLVYVQWCCWTGLGTLRLNLNKGVWSLKGTEGWLQT